MPALGRICSGCGGTSYAGPRCERCAAPVEARRRAAQPYRAAYYSSQYRAARRARLKAAGGQCEALLEHGVRCTGLAQEAHHVIPLSTARSYAEAIALCAISNLRAVCWRHNPRGGRPAAPEANEPAPAG